MQKQPRFLSQGTGAVCRELPLFQKKRDIFCTDIVTFLKGVFHSNSIGSSNQTRTNNPEIDAQIDAIASTIDDDARDAAIVELNKTLNQLCPQIPLYQGSNVRAFNSKLQGVNLTPPA